MQLISKKQSSKKFLTSPCRATTNHTNATKMNDTYYFMNYAMLIHTPSHTPHETSKVFLLFQRVLQLQYNT